MSSSVDILVELGRANISAKDVVDLQKGDVILLNQFAVDPLKVYVEGMLKFAASPGIYKGNQAVKIVKHYDKKEGHQYGAE
jgi:flagellar motor switch protein FliM